MKKAIGTNQGRLARGLGRADSGEGTVRATSPLMKSAKLMYLAGGWFFAGLAFLGVLLPLLPTTPFLLLAGTCFARSSPRLHDRILKMPVFGEYLRQWDKSHTVPRPAKQRAWILIAVSFALSAYMLESTGLRLILVVLGFGLGCLVALLPEQEADGTPGRDQNSARVETEVEDAPGSLPGEASEAAYSEGEPKIVDHSSPKRSRLPSR